VAFVEAKRDRGVDEESYSCTATIPDDGIAPASAKNAAPRSRSAVTFVEAKRDRGVDEESYSCTATIPDDGIAPASAKNAAAKK